MDRERRGPRDIPPEDRYGSGGGQSYRPGNGARDRSPPRSDGYRARSPPRRPEYLDSYKADTYRAPRPRSRTPPRRDDFRRRSPSPRGFRDREPRGGDSYRARPRSPPPSRRDDLPRDDLFRRDDRDPRDQRNIRDVRDRGYGPPPARSPPPRFRERSPLPLKRAREPSPVSSRGRRSPPQAKRERLTSPPRGRYDDYPSSRAATPPRSRLSSVPRERRASPPRGMTRDHRPRSRSPVTRNDRVDPRTVADWRRRSPAPDARQPFSSRADSGPDSGMTSRRSSPPVHPSRMALQPTVNDTRVSSARASPRGQHGDREPYRAADVEPRRRISPPLAESPYQDEHDYNNNREKVPPPREGPPQDDAPMPVRVRAPPTGPVGYRAPTSTTAPPTGPAAISAIIPSGPRGTGPPPSGPRGGPTMRGDFAPRGRGSFGTEYVPRGRGSYSATFRGARGGGPTTVPSRSESFGRSGGAAGEVAARTNESNGQDTAFSSRAPPSGPRGSYPQPTAITPATRPSNPSLTMTPFSRSQRFAPNGDAVADVPTGPKAARRPIEAPALSQSVPRIHPGLADLPKVVEGGQKAEPLVDRSKMLKLEDEAEKLRKQIEEKETRKRKSLREWDRMTRENELAALRSDLAEQALRQLNGEAESQAAF